MTFAHVAELLVGELSLPVFNDLGMSRLGSNPGLPHASRTLLHRATAKVTNLCNELLLKQHYIYSLVVVVVVGSGVVVT